MITREIPPPRLHLRISPTAEWKLRAGHPWLYAESIIDQNRTGELGELAIIYDRYNNFLALGLFDPASPLRVRVLLLGKPQSIDNAWWRSRFLATVHRRDGLFNEQTTGYRLIHGESDGWPGLVLDRYNQTLVLKLYTAAWLRWLEQIAHLITEETQVQSLVLRLSRNIQSVAQHQFHLAEGQALHGSVPKEPVTFLESGLRFEADVLHGQKTGFFLDQRENRRLVESLAAGRDVLNLFSFSGGFSLYAARGGAQSATDVDISAHALEGARRNFKLNQSNRTVIHCRHETIQADVFEWSKSNAQEQFDLVILDPPSFARREAERERAIEAYGQLTRLSLGRLRAGGVLLAASCSAHVSAMEFFEMTRQTARKSGRRFEEMQTTRHPPDHPATFPEAEYLKCIFLRLLD